MKTKIAVLGNSHLSAFKLGWEIIKNDFPDLELTFFGSPTTSMRFFKVENNTLVPTTDKVLENIRWTSDGYDYIPGDMDAYILVGMGYSFIHLIDLWKNHRLFKYYNKDDESKQLISESFLEKSMEGTLRNSNALTLIDMLKKITTSPLVYAPNPYASINILQDGNYDYYHFDDLMKKAYDYYFKCADSLFLEREVFFAVQPESTIHDNMFTQDVFSRNSIKLKSGLDSKHASSDYFHMNAEFGAVSLRDIFLNYSFIKNH